MKVKQLVNKLSKIPTYEWWMKSYVVGHSYEVVLKEFKVELSYSGDILRYFYLKVFSKHGVFIEEANVYEKSPGFPELFEIYQSLEELNSACRDVLKERFDAWLDSDDTGSKFSMQKRWDGRSY
jgi:hypothetical protein